MKQRPLYLAICIGSYLTPTISGIALTMEANRRIKIVNRGLSKVSGNTRNTPVTPAVPAVIPVIPTFASPRAPRRAPPPAPPREERGGEMRRRLSLRVCS